MKAPPPLEPTYAPVRGGGYTPGRWGVNVRKLRGTDRAASVTVTAPSGYPLARLDIETVSDLEAIRNARLMACAPRMASALHTLDGLLCREGLALTHPARELIALALDTALRTPTEYL